MKPSSIPFLRPRRGTAGFTLIELLVAITILILLLLMVFSMVDQTQRTWSRATSEANQFREARLAFETMSRRIRQATLNTYYDYEFGSNQRPTNYIRQSELHFVCGPTSRMTGRPENVYPTHGIFFQAPFGYTADSELTSFSELLNAWGYFIEFTDDRETLPPFLRGVIHPKFRFRLKEFRLPAEELDIYEDADRKRRSTSSSDRDWFVDYVGESSQSELVKRTVAENILALIILPMKATPERGASESETFYTTGYNYDSRFGLGDNQDAPGADDTLHLLPSLVKITMIAIDERTAIRLENGNTPPQILPPGLFTSPRNLERDIRTIEEAFENHRPKLDYRIFTSTVAIRESRWIGRDDDDEN